MIPEIDVFNEMGKEGEVDCNLQINYGTDECFISENRKLDRAATEFQSGGCHKFRSQVYM